MYLIYSNVPVSRWPLTRKYTDSPNVTADFSPVCPARFNSKPEAEKFITALENARPHVVTWALTARKRGEK